MSRIVTITLVLAVLACVSASPQGYNVHAQAGSIAVGQVSDGRFGNDAFGIGHGGNVYSPPPYNGGYGGNGGYGSG